MGIVGRYIDALSDEQRDNVIEADGFGYGQMWDDEGRGCLVAVAEVVVGAPIAMPIAQRFCNEGQLVGCTFDNLCYRFGKARIVAACKARAAIGNAPTVSEVRALEAV